MDSKPNEQDVFHQQYVPKHPKTESKVVIWSWCTPPNINSLNLKSWWFGICFSFPEVYSQVPAVNLPGCKWWWCWCCYMKGGVWPSFFFGGIYPYFFPYWKIGIAIFSYRKNHTTLMLLRSGEHQLRLRGWNYQSTIIYCVWDLHPWWLGMGFLFTINSMLDLHSLKLT